jgi:hypothetical protein
MRKGIGRFSFLPLPFSTLLEEFIYSNSKDRRFERMGFDWDVQQSFTPSNKFSNDDSEVSGALGSSVLRQTTILLA